MKSLPRPVLRTDIEELFKSLTKGDTIPTDKFIEFLNEKQRDSRLNEILYPQYNRGALSTDQYARLNYNWLPGLPIVRTIPIFKPMMHSPVDALRAFSPKTPPNLDLICLAKLFNNPIFEF